MTSFPDGVVRGLDGRANGRVQVVRRSQGEYPRFRALTRRGAVGPCSPLEERFLDHYSPLPSCLVAIREAPHGGQTHPLSLPVSNDIFLYRESTTPTSRPLPQAVRGDYRGKAVYRGFFTPTLEMHPRDTVSMENHSVGAGRSFPCLDVSPGNGILLQDPHLQLPVSPLKIFRGWPPLSSRKDLTEPR